MSGKKVCCDSLATEGLRVTIELNGGGATRLLCRLLRPCGHDFLPVLRFSAPLHPRQPRPKPGRDEREMVGWAITLARR
jgi:hypothetical protein